MEEMRRREVIRSSNNPAADYAEHLCVQALSLALARKSVKGYDATDAAGKRYQIKGRRLTRQNPSRRQLGALRELDEKPFDYMAAVLFNEDLTVRKACLLPRNQVQQHSAYVKRTNSYRFLLADSVWELHGVVDITKKVKAAQAKGARS
ncbi:MAG TPA: hypothetical protein VLU54_08505 [Casimicrobiaceae bacterium]|nr:hypothetical protein [Casimicrobiaceae bacterium]